MAMKKTLGFPALRVKTAKPTQKRPFDVLLPARNQRLGSPRAHGQIDLHPRPLGILVRVKTESRVGVHHLALDVEQYDHAHHLLADLAFDFPVKPHRPVSAGLGDARRELVCRQFVPKCLAPIGGLELPQPRLEKHPRRRDDFRLGQCPPAIPSPSVDCKFQTSPPEWRTPCRLVSSRRPICISRLAARVRPLRQLFEKTSRAAADMTLP